MAEHSADGRIRRDGVKAFLLKKEFDIEGIKIEPGSIVLVDESGITAMPSNDEAEEVPDGTPISIPASRTEPV